MAARACRSHQGPRLDFPVTPADLGALRGLDHCVWILYAFPGDVRLRFPAPYEDIRSHARVVATFPATVGGGAIFVARLDGA